MTAPPLGCLHCVICNTNSFHSFYTNLAYIQSHQIPSQVCVCGGGGGGQLIYIVFPYRYVNIQSVFLRRRSRAEFGLVWNSNKIYGKCSKISNTFLCLFSTNIRAGIHKILVRIAKNDDTDQTVSSEAV